MMPAGSQPLIRTAEQFHLDQDHANTAAIALDQEQPLVALWEIRDALQQLTAMQAYAVARAREAGATWQEVAERLGTSRQAAQQRYGG